MRKILIIHEVRTIQNLLQRYVTSELSDSQVIIAGTQEEAIACLDNEPFHVVIAANTMKLWTGMDIYEEVQKSKKNKNIPFILISASLNEDMISKLKKAGIENYLQTPFDAKTLARIINDLCNPKKWRTNERFAIPGTIAEVHYQHDDVKAELVNISKGGFLCDMYYSEECRDLIMPTRITLQLPEDYGSARIRNLPCAVLRLEVIEFHEDRSPKRLRMVLMFLNVSESNQNALNAALEQAKDDNNQSNIE